MPAKWYTSISILLVVLVSVLGILMAGLMLLLVPSPADVIRDMNRKMAALERFHVETHSEWRGEKGEFAFDSSGRVDTRGEGPYAANHSFSYTGELAKGPILQGEMRRGSGASVYRFSILPQDAENRLAALKDRWLRVDSPQVLRRLDIPLVGAGRRALTEEERRTLVQGFVRTPFLAVRQYVNTEKLDDGTPVYHYAVDVEPLFIKDVLMRADETALGRPLVARERQVFDEFFADVKVESLELWIGTHDHLLRRADATIRVDDGKRRGKLRIQAAFSLFDEASVEPVPTDVQIDDATPIVLSFLPGLAGGRLPVAETGSIGFGEEEPSRAGLPVDVTIGEGDADGDGLSDLLEGFYRADPRNPDTDGDGVNDGEEVFHGQSPTGSGALFDFTGGRYR